MQSKEFNDLLRDVVSGEIDIGIAYMVVDPDNYDRLDFSHPIVHFT